MERKPVVVGVVMIAVIVRFAWGATDAPAHGAARGPLALASADLDEDGVPDFVAADSSGAAGGTIHVYRGKPGMRRASSRAALRTTGPFDPSNASVDLSPAPDFLATGDFDADGHVDVVVAERGADVLTMLPGDGTGAFAAPRAFSLPGPLDALAAGEVNRSDGLVDLVAGVNTPSGPRLTVIESPEGAFEATPEELSLPGRAVAIVIADLNGDFMDDVVVATRTALVIVGGRDRRLAGSRAERAELKPPAVRSIRLTSVPVRMVAGRFLGQDEMGLALLDENGIVWVADGRSPDKLRPLPGRYPGASELSVGHVRGGAADDLIVLDKFAQTLRLIRPDEGTDVAIDVAGLAAVLPMRLDEDALDDLLVLTEAGGAEPLATVMTSVQSTFVVTNANDSGAGSLRQAIADANNTPGSDTITFNIPGSNIAIILPLSPLPALAGSVTLDATTQPGYAGSPRVEIDGTASGPLTDGLMLNFGDNVVRGLDVHGFQGNGIVIDGAGHNVVEACYVGTDPMGTLGLANGLAGVLIRNSHINTVGGTTPAARNVVSGNAGRGVAIVGSAANAGGASSGPGVAICDLCTVTLPVNVVLDERITYLYLRVNIQHTYDGDLRLTLIAPDGTRVLLSEFNGGSGDNYTNTTFDDQAVTPIKSASAPFSGSYVPEQPLSAVYGMNAQGTWTLEVQDAASGDVGFLSGWNLSFLSVSTFGNVIQGNFIGTDAAGASALASPNGVVIDQSPGNRVGGTSIGARNVISGAAGQGAGNGVLISGALSTQNVVEGNYIGTNVSGTGGVPNRNAGVLISSAGSCRVGGTAAGASNLVSGNGLWGVRAELSDRTEVMGNFVGTTASGTAAIGNNAQQAGGAGVAMINGNANRVGGAVPAARNVISGNADQAGLEFYDDIPNCCTGEIGIGNSIGTDVSGTQALPNQLGVFLHSHGGIVGGPGPGEGNVISGNSHSGVYVGLNTDGSVVSGNIIGLDRTGTATLGNLFGISLTGKAVTVGGTTPGASNTIAGNTTGISVNEDCPSDVDHPTSTDTPKLIPDLATTTSSIFEPLDEPLNDLQVKLNLTHTYDSDLILTLIGPDGTRVTLSNRHGGSGANYIDTRFEAIYASTPIGAGSPPFTGTFLADEPLPVFTGRSAMGTWTLEISDVAGGDSGALWDWSIDFTTNEPNNEKIIGNFIGTNSSGASGLGNALYGVDIATVCGLRIGGPAAGEGNVISGNAGYGLRLNTNADSPSTVVQANLIGLKPDGISPLGNGSSGIFAAGHLGTIGGPGSSYGNKIAYNSGAGIAVGNFNAMKQTSIRFNSIHDNGGLGIDLGSDGVTLNDANDADAGPNLLVNFPFISSVTPLVNGTMIAGTLSAAPNSKYLIDVYANPSGDPSGYGEGQTWLTSAQILTDGIGNASWSLFTQLTGVHFVTATASDFVGNTSEFSGAFSSPMEASAPQDMIVAPNGGSSLKLTYTPACGATNHVVYWGLAGPTAIGSGGLVWMDSACALGTSGTAVFDPGTPPAGKFFYFVIVGHNAFQEGSYGKDSAAIERPEAVRIGNCDHTQSLPQSCQ
jgi:subtilisin-like proprotein convertase family protein